jgi:DNA-binding transcriptional regulator YiaG
MLSAMKRSPKRAKWDAASVRGLRRHMALTQDQLADEMGVRQQTVSEWETGAYSPRGASARLLTIIADRAAYVYQVADQGEAEATDAGRT